MVQERRHFSEKLQGEGSTNRHFNQKVQPETSGRRFNLQKVKTPRRFLHPKF